MATSFITDQVDQELQLTDLQNMNGGNVASVFFGAGIIIGAGGFLMADMILLEETGKGVGEHFIDAVGAASEWVKDQTDVAPTPDGKGCTDRDLPF